MGFLVSLAASLAACHGLRKSRPTKYPEISLQYETVWVEWVDSQVSERVQVPCDRKLAHSTACSAWFCHGNARLMNVVENYRQEAERFCQVGDWQAADEQFRRAVTVSPDHETRLAYGMFLAEREAYGAAIAQFLLAQDELQESGRLEPLSVIFSNLATIYRRVGQFDLARRFQRQVLSLRGSADADDLLDWCADALLSQKTQLAESLAQTALSLAEDAEDVGLQAKAHGLLGIISARRGQHRRALSGLIRAARGHQAVDDPAGLAVDYSNLAEVSRLIDRPAWHHWFLTAAGQAFQRAGMTQSQQQIAERMHALRFERSGNSAEPRWN